MFVHVSRFGTGTITKTGKDKQQQQTILTCSPFVCLLNEFFFRICVFECVFGKWAVYNSFTCEHLATRL